MKKIHIWLPEKIWETFEIVEKLKQFKLSLEKKNWSK